MPPCINTSEFLHAAMRPDVLTETVVEVSTEDSEPMEVVTVLQEPEMLETEPNKRRKCENISTYSKGFFVNVTHFLTSFLTVVYAFHPFSWAETQTPSHFKRISRSGHQEKV